MRRGYPLRRKSTPLRVSGAKKLIAADVTTEEYPGFATDMQAQFMALATQARGVSHIRETIFENRMIHASEMVRMGANIAIDGNSAVGYRADATQRRAGHSVRFARQRRPRPRSSGRRQHTCIDRVYHIDRGYERIEEKLRARSAPASSASPLGSTQRAAIPKAGNFQK